jgi:acyl dehydratase
MRIIADGFILDSSSMGGPGVDEVRWLKPLRPGARIRVRTTVLDTRASSSRPQMGLVKFLFEVLDEGDVILMTLTTTLMFGRRQLGTLA